MQHAHRVGPHDDGGSDIQQLGREFEPDHLQFVIDLSAEVAAHEATDRTVFDSDTFHDVLSVLGLPTPAFERWRGSR